MSLCASGTPWRGPSSRPALRSRSRRSAVCNASSGSRAILALIVGSPALKASSAASVRATAVTSPWRTPSPPSWRALLRLLQRRFEARWLILECELPARPLEPLHRRGQLAGKVVADCVRRRNPRPELRLLLDLLFDVLAHRPSTGCTTAPRSNSMNHYGGCPKSSVTKAPAGLDYISSTMPALWNFP